MKVRQAQEGGTGSHNMQAGHDIILSAGVTATEVREIALDVFKSNFFDLGNDARETAFSRAEQLTDEYVIAVEERAPAALSNTADPDVRRTIYNAQNEFACSGEDELRSLLVDLLVARTSEGKRDVRALALNEAVVAAPKLTKNQRAALAVAFLIGHTRYAGPLNLDAFFDHVDRDLSPFVGQLPERDSEYQHLASVGVATSGLGLASQSFAGRYKEMSAEFFRRGFSRETLEGINNSDVFLTDHNIFVSALRNPTNFQLSPSMSNDRSNTNLIDETYPGLSKSLTDLGQSDLMSEDEVLRDFISRLPRLEPLIKLWDRSQIRRMHLTSSGIAIGHTLWSEESGGNANLNIWL